MPPPTLSHSLTADRAAAFAGAPLLCLADEGIGRAWSFYAARPGFDAKADVKVAAVEPDGARALVSTVRLFGPMLQRSGPQGECMAWADGYDTFAERMLAAFAVGNVHLLVDGPGGVLTGLPECVSLLVAEKARLGRKVHVTVVGMCASAAYAIASALADPGEFYATQSSQAGSIGVRAAHEDISGRLAKDGIVRTNFSFPPGKIALSPDAPLTPEGKALGESEVMDGFEWFAGSVTDARPALTRDAIVDLKGYLYTGEKAVKAGLVDAIAAVGEVEQLALAQAARDIEGARAHGDGFMALRAEDGPKDGEKPPGDDGIKPTGVCKKCGVGNPLEHKFCAQCGESMEAKPLAEPEEEDSEARKARAAAFVTTASMPSLKSMVLSLENQIGDVATALHGSKSRTAIGAKVEAVVADAARIPGLLRERDEQRSANLGRERLDILKALSDAGVHSRGEMLVDILSADGKPTGQAKAAKLWSDGPEGRTMPNLRAYATAKIPGGGGGKEASPYAAPPAEADEAAALARGPVPTVAKTSPAVRAAVRAGVPDDEAAAILAREFGGAR